MQKRTSNWQRARRCVFPSSSNSTVNVLLTNIFKQIFLKGSILLALSEASCLCPEFSHTTKIFLVLQMVMEREFISWPEYTLLSFSCIGEEWIFIQVNVLQQCKVILKTYTRVFRLDFLNHSDYSSIRDYLESQLYQEMEIQKKISKHFFSLDFPNFFQQIGQLAQHTEALHIQSSNELLACFLITWTIPLWKNWHLHSVSCYVIRPSNLILFEKSGTAC